MNINDKNMIYEISQQLPRSSQKDTEQIKNQQAVDGKESPTSKEPQQDALVNFSPQLQSVKTARDIIASEPDVRQEKVARFKAMIESGKYPLDHKTVANKMVDFYLDENF